MPFVKVGEDAGTIAVGQGTLVESGGVAVAVFNGGSGRFYACGAICPHEDGPLAEGWIEGDAVVCPWHGFEFDVCTGRHPTKDSVRLKAVGIRVHNGDLYVSLPKA